VVPDVDTRWYSKIDTAESVLKACDEIEQILIDRDSDSNGNDIEKLEAIDRTKLEQLFRLLEPFHRSILEVEKTTYPTSPLVVLIYQKLLNSLSVDGNEEQWISSLKLHLRDAVQRKVIITREHQISTIFHPSFRMLEMPSITAIDKRYAYNEIWNMIADFPAAVSSEVGEEIASIDASSNPKRARVAADSFLDEFCTRVRYA